LLVWPFPDLVGGTDPKFALFVTFGPYAGLQFVRSTIWSVKTLRNHDL
jgi:hypothetical protein